MPGTIDFIVPCLLALLGLLLSLRLFRQGLGHGGLPGCGAGSGCDHVTRSRWAQWLGVPVAGPAAGVYAVALGAIVIAHYLPTAQAGPIALDVLLVIAPLLAGAAAWFIALQAVVIRRFCLYCLLLHGIGLAVALAIGFDLPGGPPGFAYAGLAGGKLLLVLGAAGATILALIIGQVLGKPRTFVVKASAGLSLEAADEVNTG